MGDLSASAGEQEIEIAPTTARTGKVAVDANSVVLLTDAVGANEASLIGTGTQKIADFADLKDVADYLNEGLSVTSNSSNVFIVKQEGATDVSHAYYFDDANGSGIEAGELDYLGTISGAVTITEILFGNPIT